MAELLALVGRVVRIEHAADGLGADRLLRRRNVVAMVEAAEVEHLDRLGGPKAEGVDVATLPARDRGVVGDRLDGLVGVPVGASLAVEGDVTAELDLVGDLEPLELPDVAGNEPVLGLLDLPAVVEALAEKAVLVADAVAVGGNAEGRHRIHEAGGEPAEAAVAEGGVAFLAQHGVVVEAEAAERGAHRAEQAEVRHRVVQQAADQEFHRQIVDPLAMRGVGAVRGLEPGVDHMIAHGHGDGGRPVLRGRGLAVLAYRIGQLVEDGALHLFRGYLPLLGGGDRGADRGGAVHRQESVVGHGTRGAGRAGLDRRILVSFDGQVQRTRGKPRNPVNLNRFCSPLEHVCGARVTPATTKLHSKSDSVGRRAR
jgi:hypothetical protein